MFEQLFRNCMFWTFLSLTIGCCWTFNQSEHWLVNFVLRRKSQRRFIAYMAMCHNNTGTLKNVNRWKTHENCLFADGSDLSMKSLPCPVNVKPNQIKPRKRKILLKAHPTPTWTKSRHKKDKQMKSPPDPRLDADCWAESAQQGTQVPI